MEPSAKKLKVIDETTDKRVNLETIENQVSVRIKELGYDEIRLIFKFLKAKELWKAACVCKTWKDAAAKEVNTRLFPQYFFERFETVKTNSNFVQYYNSEKLANDLRIKPYLGLVFVKLNHGCHPWVPSACFFHHVPSSCKPLAMVCGIDVIADDKDTTKIKNLAVATFLPNIKNLRVDSYNLLLQEQAPGTNEENFKQVKQFFENFVWNLEDKSKCVILLTTLDSYTFTKQITEYFQKMYEPGTVSLWGGVCADLKICDTPVHTVQRMKLCSKSVAITAICLSSPSLQSWSIVFSEFCKSKDEIEKRLQDLKKQICLKKHSLALMCTCVTRKEHNKICEISAFKRVFPKMPLVGFVGYGEYGLNTLNQVREKTIQLSHSTVLLILTYE